MNLGKATSGYDTQEQNKTRALIEKSDAQNYKRGQDLYFSTSQKLFLSYASTITAHAGGGKASATVLSALINHVTVCATAADSLLLMPAKAGLRVSIINRGANAAQVFGQGTDTINDVATATGVSQAASTVAHYDCPVDGAWYRLLSA